MTENATIRPLICDSWRISLIDLANEVLQFSERKTIDNKNKEKSFTERVYVTLERSFGILKVFEGVFLKE